MVFFPLFGGLMLHKYNIKNIMNAITYINKENKLYIIKYS